jgi:putative endonuclease
VWYVYFLKLNNDDIYVGSTNDLRRRVKSHQDGHVPSTKFHLPAAFKSYVVALQDALRSFGHRWKLSAR